jgi:hypothetical protein
MNRIRVDTDQLQREAGDFDSLGIFIRQLGNHVARIAASMPSYEGQLSGPARTAGMETESRASALNGKQIECARQLSQLSAAYQSVDQETVGSFQVLSDSIRARDKQYSENDGKATDIHVLMARLFLETAGVKLVGDWTDEEILAVAAAVEKIGEKFKTILETMKFHPPDAASAFLMIFGCLTLYYGDKQPGATKLKGYWGISGDHQITFQPGKVTDELVEHELGHELAFLLYDNNKGFENIPNHPIEKLIHEGVWTEDGDFVTGDRNGSYDRNGGLTSKEGNGYRSDDYHEGFQLHPRTMGPDGNSADEDWADIFMNWTSDGSFAPNSHGEALFKWVNTNMPTWLRMAIEKNAGSTQPVQVWGPESGKHGDTYESIKH